MEILESGNEIGCGQEKDPKNHDKGRHLLELQKVEKDDNPDIPHYPDEEKLGGFEKDFREVFEIVDHRVRAVFADGQFHSDCFQIFLIS